MIEKRVKAVNAKRIKASDIRALARIFQDEYSRLLQMHEEDINKGKKEKYVDKPKLNSDVTTKDGVEYSSDSMELFESGGILDNKVVTELSLRLSYALKEARIWVHIADSQLARYQSFIQIEGNDSTWVHGTFSKLTECVDSWEKQDAKLKRFRWPISFFAAIVAGFSVGWLFTIPLRGAEEGSQSNDAIASIFVFISLITAMIVLFFLPDYLNKLWPDIEIVPVLEHERKLDKRRKYLWIVVSEVDPIIRTG